MKKIYFIFLFYLSFNSFGQIQHEVNKNGGTTVTNATNDIDSIRFNTSTEQMEIVLNNGSVISHNLADVVNVTFSGSATGYINCGTITDVVEVSNPNTGEIWMDRNLGASQVATSSTDADSYGDLFQWGRFADGHQCRNSGTTTVLSTADNPGHDDFIINATSYIWRDPQNDNLWQGENGINNPCPSGYRLPTTAELEAEVLDWFGANAAGAFASPLKFPMAGSRVVTDGTLYNVGSVGRYWTSTPAGANARGLRFDGTTAFVANITRGVGYSIRCIKD